MSSPIRTYITQNKDQLKSVAFFCTEGSAGAENAFKELEEISGKKPKATLEITAADIKKGTDADKIKKFANELMKA